MKFEALSDYVCKEHPWLKSCLERVNLRQDINENILTNEICSRLETDQSQTFAVLCVLWALPSQINTRVSLGNQLGLHSGL